MHLKDIIKSSPSIFHAVLVLCTTMTSTSVVYNVDAAGLAALCNQYDLRSIVPGAKTPISPLLCHSEHTNNCRIKDLRVGNKYRIGRKIGSGSFGDIYLGMKAVIK